MGTRYPAAEAIARSVLLTGCDGIEFALADWSVEFEAKFRCTPDQPMIAAATSVLADRLANKVPDLPPSASGTWPPGLLLRADEL